MGKKYKGLLFEQTGNKVFLISKLSI